MKIKTFLSKKSLENQYNNQAEGIPSMKLMEIIAINETLNSKADIFITSSSPLSDERKKSAVIYGGDSEAD